MTNIQQLGDQFANTVGGKATLKQNGCTVSLQRDFQVMIQGRASKSVLPVAISFEALDNSGLALNLAEITILEEEVAQFSQALASQGLTISALHNHWIHAQPNILYIHVQSVEAPMDFAKKIAASYKALTSLPVQGS